MSETTIFDVRGDTIKPRKYDSFNSGSKGYYTAVFNFDSAWDGLIPHITISENGKKRADEIIKDNTFKIAVTESGTMRVGVYGLDAEGNKCISSNEVLFDVQKGAYDGTPSLPSDIWKGYQITVLGYVERAEAAANDSTKNAKVIADSINTAVAASEIATESKEASMRSEERAKESEENAAESKKAATQAYSDLLEMVHSGQIATLIDGKIPVENIPSIATTELFFADSEEKMNGIDAQRGDICIRTDENKSYIYDGAWVYLVSPNDFVARAGHADTATNATNANTINGHRVIEMTAEEFEAAVKNPDTYYLVY